MPKLERRVPVTELRPDAPALIVRIPAQDPGLKRYLTERGLSPGKEVVLNSIEPYGGPVWLTTSEGRHAVSPEVAGQVLAIPRTSNGAGDE